jgi:hypothetical protein
MRPSLLTLTFALSFLAPAIYRPLALRAQAVPAATPPVSPPPATKVEAFRPAAGSVVTFGYNELGEISGISVDARELRDTRGAVVRGVAVQVTESQYRDERSFVDADELPELLKGIDALLAVQANPTRYENFEVRYTTKGELQITVFNSGQKIRYSVRAGRVTTAQAFIDEADLRNLRSMFEAANQLLKPPQPAK